MAENNATREDIEELKKELLGTENVGSDSNTEVVAEREDICSTTESDHNADLQGVNSDDNRNEHKEDVTRKAIEELKKWLSADEEETKLPISSTTGSGFSPLSIKWQMYISAQIYFDKTFHGHLYGLIDRDMQSIYIISTGKNRVEGLIDFGNVDEVITASDGKGNRIFRKKDNGEMNYFFHIDHSGYGFVPRDKVNYNWEAPIEELRAAMEIEAQVYRERCIEHRLYWEEWEKIDFTTELKVVIISGLEMADLSIDNLRKQYSLLNSFYCENCHVLYRNEEGILGKDEGGSFRQCPRCRSCVRIKHVVY